MAKIGDTVRFLNSIGGGRIVKIEGNIAHVEDADGFEVPMLLRECVVVMEAEKQAKITAAAEAEVAGKAPKGAKDTSAPKPEPAPLPVIETAEGNKINVELAFEPLELKKLSTTDFEITLVNDSNYYINFVYATRADGDKEWTLCKADTVEPNIMLSLGQLKASEINSVENILFQCVAYKNGRTFELKQPASVNLHVDTTKFCKLHCFRAGDYFDAPVLSFRLVADDKSYAPIKVSANDLEEAMRQKRAADRPVARPIKKRPIKGSDILEIDLHINELIDNTNGMSRADMLNLQIDEFRRVMDANLKNHGKKIVFIHGKGEGILRQALLKELNHRYKGHDVCDASFREYGFGATQVTIH